MGSFRGPHAPCPLLYLIKTPGKQFHLEDSFIGRATAPGTYNGIFRAQGPEEDQDWKNKDDELRISRLRQRRGRSIVHRSLEDNYGAVVVANHEALAQFLDQVLPRSAANFPPATYFRDPSLSASARLLIESQIFFFFFFSSFARSTTFYRGTRTESMVIYTIQYTVEFLFV